MSVNVKIEIEPALIETLEALDDKTLAAICDEEMDSRINYLEAVVRGWKKYKNVQHEHRRALFLMLCSSNKDALQKYERLVLFPKVQEMERKSVVKQFKDGSKRRDVASVSSTAELGAELSENSAGEDSLPSPVPEPAEDIPLDLYDVVDFDDDSNSETSESPNRDDTNNQVMQVADNALDQLENALLAERDDGASRASSSGENPQSSALNRLMERYSQPKLNSLRTAIGAYETDMGLDSNGKTSPQAALAENILEAVVQVRLAIDKVEEVQADTIIAPGMIPPGMSPAELANVEAQLIETVSLILPKKTVGGEGVSESHEEPNVEVAKKVNCEEMSAGQKKRAKKAARKEATRVMKDIAAKKTLEEEQATELRKAKLAAEALSSLGMMPTTSTLPAATFLPAATSVPAATSDLSKYEQHSLEISKMLSENSPIPITEADVNNYLKMSSHAVSSAPPSIDGATMLKMFAANEKSIQESLVGAIGQQLSRNRVLKKSINETAVHVPPMPNHRQPKDEEVWRTAKNFVVQKLKLWKQSDDPSAPYYIQMYSHFLVNISMSVAKLIHDFMPIKSIPDAQFEKTLLMQYQAGKFPLPEEVEGEVPI